MNRKIRFAEGEYYHLYNRGVDKRKIFSDERDYVRFISLLFVSNSDKKFLISEHAGDLWSFEELVEKHSDKNCIISVGAWCLMPNHFHLLVRQNTPQGISEFMKKLLGAYATYFNKKYRRSGTLFESRFKAEHVDEDRYLKYLYAYIHLNPIGIIDKGWKNKMIEDKKKAKEFLLTYGHSSLFDYLKPNTRVSEKILNRKEFPKYFETSQKFSAMLDGWMNFNKE